MKWATTSHDDLTDPITDYTTNLQAMSDLSPKMTAFLAPIPSLPLASDWPTTTALPRDLPSDLPYDLSLTSCPEFQTHFAHDQSNLPEDDDMSSEFHGAMSTSEETSLAHENIRDSHSLASTQLHPIAAENIQTLLHSHSLPNLVPTPVMATSLPIPISTALPHPAPGTSSMTLSLSPDTAIQIPTHTLPVPSPVVRSPSTPVPVSVKKPARPAKALTISKPPITKAQLIKPAPLPKVLSKSELATNEARNQSIKSPNGAKTNISLVTSKVSSESRTSPHSPPKPVKIVKKSERKLPSSVSTGAVTSPPTASNSGGGSTRASGVVSHTKLCRDRLNNMFEKLKHTLPPAPSGVEVKHKAQVLDYTIAVLKNMIERTSQLEIELAVSSNKATMEWISKLVSRTDSFPQAAEEVMRLITKRSAWAMSELWVAVNDRGATSSGTEHDFEDSVTLTLCRTVLNEVNSGSNVGLFSEESKATAFRAGEGVPGRVWLSMRPEWVTGLSVSESFKRADLARKYGVKACMGIPVTITGKVEGIMCFYDVKHRGYDNRCLELAMRLGWALGNAIGGVRANLKASTPSGASES